MSALDTFIDTGVARAASQDSAMLASAAGKAMGALQWALAENLWNQAADALPRDPHTQAETLQAQSHRRSARNCKALVNTSAPMRLIKDNPDHGALQRQHQQQIEEEQRNYWRAE